MFKKLLSVLLSISLLLTMTSISVMASEVSDEAEVRDYYVRSPGYVALASGNYSVGEGTKDNPAATVGDVISIINDDQLGEGDIANVYILQRKDWSVYDGTKIGKTGDAYNVPYHSMTSWSHSAHQNTQVFPEDHTFTLVIKADNALANADSGKIYLAYADQLGCNNYLQLGGPTVFEGVTLVSQRLAQQPVVTNGNDLTFAENCTYGYLDGINYSTTSTKVWDGTVRSKTYTYFMGYRTIGTSVKGFDVTINNSYAASNNYFYFPANYTSSKSATVSGDVNITINNASAKIPFVWGTGKAGAIYTFENININVKSATAVTNAISDGGVAVSGGLQVIIHNGIEFDTSAMTNVTATDTDGDEADETALSNKLWIIKNNSGNDELITFAKDQYGKVIPGKFVVADGASVDAVSDTDSSIIRSSNKEGILDLSDIPGEYIINSVTKCYDYYVAHGGTGGGTDINNPAPSVAAAVTTMNSIGGLNSNDTANIWIMQDIAAVSKIDETVSSGGKTYNQHNLAYWGSVPSHTAKISVKPHSNNQANNKDANLPTYLAVVNTVGDNSQMNFAGPTEIDNIKIVYCSKSNTENQGDGRINFNGNSVKLGSGVKYCYSPVDSTDSTTWNGALTDITSLTTDITTGNTTEKVFTKPIEVELAHSINGNNNKGGFIYLPAYSTAYNTFQKDVTLRFTGSAEAGRLLIGHSSNTYPITFKQNFNVKITESGGSWEMRSVGNIIVEGGIQMIVSDKITTRGTAYPLSTIYSKAFTTSNYKTKITNHWILNVNDAMVEAIDFIENEKGKFTVPEYHSVVATNVNNTSLTYTADENGILDLSKVPGEYSVVIKQLEVESDTYKDYINYRGYNENITNYNGALANTFKKLSSETDLNVVYMGGSAMGTLKEQIGGWFGNNFSDVTINNINKSLNNTGTTFGALRVSRDVLSKLPDLVFIEYSLDDYKQGVSDGKSQIQFETIVREIKETYPDCDIVTLFASTSEMGSELCDQAKAQEEICKKYNISSINLGNNQKIHFNIIKEFLANTLLFGKYGTGYELTEQVLPEMTSKYMLDGNVSFAFPIETKYTTAGGSSYNSEAQAFGIADYVGVITVPARSNDTITVTFEGTELSMLTNSGYGASNAYEVSVDGGEFVTAQYGGSILTVIATDLESGKHTVVIESALNSQVGVCGFYTRDMAKITNNLNICDLVYLDENNTFDGTLDYNNDQVVDNNDLSALKKILLADDYVKPDYFDTSHLIPIARLGWRPYTGNIPQQSIPSYEKAYETGHRIMLCDIRLTSDGYMVCCHDDDISKVNAYDSKGVKVPSGTVKISETTLEELLTYDFGKHKTGYAGLQIMQPEEFLEFCAQYDDITPVFEFKKIDDQRIAQLINLVKQYGFENNVMFLAQADNGPVVGSALPNAVIGRWCQEVNDNLINVAESFGSAGKLLHVDTETKSTEDTVSFENYVKAKSKGVDLGITYIGSNDDGKAYFNELKNRGIFNFCKYISLDEISWLYE